MADTPRARRRTRLTVNAVAVAPFTVVVDTREQLPWTFAGVSADADRGGGNLVVPVVVAGLPAGDYSIRGFETRIAVERKSLCDLYGTVGQGRDRFVRELERLAEYDFAAVVVEAEWSEIYGKPPPHTVLKPKTIFRSMLAWQQRYPRVHWLFWPGRAAAEVVGYRVLERWWREREKEGGTDSAEEQPA